VTRYFHRHRPPTPAKELHNANGVHYCSPGLRAAATLGHRPKHPFTPTGLCRIRMIRVMTQPVGVGLYACGMFTG